MLFWKRAARVGLMVLIVAGGTPVANSAVPASGSYTEIELLKGDIETIPTRNLKRVSITDPKVADINDARAESVEIIGIENGQTVLFVWDDSGKSTIIIRVVQEDLVLLQKRIESLLKSAGIEGVVVKANTEEGKVIVSGQARDDKNDAVKKLLEPFSERIINFIQKQKEEKLVQIDVQVTELNTTLTKELGVDWGNGSYAYTENYVATDTHIPRQNGTLKDLFKIGDFSRTAALTATVNALIQQGRAKILSKPRLVVVSGKEATFLVGGQIPIKQTTTSASGGAQTQNTTFKDYGVNMAITPTIDDNRTINVLLNVSISDIDASKPAGTDIAFLTRSAQTQLVMEDHQTIVLAGMIKRSTNQMTNRVPYLSKIPVLGMFFRYTHTNPANEETEVVISITSTILQPEKRKQTNAGVAAAAQPAPEKSAPTMFDAYAVSVQAKIGSAIAYPFEAQEKGWEGVVKLALVIQKDGTLKSVSVKDSSGHDVFDQDAVNTAQILSPYAAFPLGMDDQEVSLNIPIIYSLDAIAKNANNPN